MRNTKTGGGEGLEIVTVRLPDELLQMLDDLVARGIYASRSEAIREFARAYVIKEARHG